jgi:hypothetical protein
MWKWTGCNRKHHQFLTFVIVKFAETAVPKQNRCDDMNCFAIKSENNFATRRMLANRSRLLGRMNLADGR